MTKFAHRVTQAEEIPRLVAHAFRMSIAGAPGIRTLLFVKSSLADVAQDPF